MVAGDGFCALGGGHTGGGKALMHKAKLKSHSLVAPSKGAGGLNIDYSI